MSDGQDPRHRPPGLQRIALDEWVFELTQLMIKRGYVRRDVSTVAVYDEVKTFAEQVVRATRNGHFHEVS